MLFELSRDTKTLVSSSAQGSRKLQRIGAFIHFIYMIITTEQMIARNPDAQETLQKWSFGQAFALILLAQHFMDCVSYVQDWRMIPDELRLGFFQFSAPDPMSYPMHPMMP
jgi:hypothetical protein